MSAIPIEEALARPLFSLLVSALVPIASARALFALLVPRLAPDDPREEARLLAPFRSAAFVVGLVQLQLAWMLGASALGPALVSSPSAIACELFGALCAITAFGAGGVGRLVEERDRSWRATRAAIALRLRLVPWFGGPVIAAGLAARLPSIAWEDGEVVVRWGVVALALLVVAIGTAYGGLMLAVASRALLPASAEVRAIAQAAARAEGVSLFAVLRLPTGAARLANAAAIPWARTMVVSDRIVELLAPSELRAVLAHEAGHLSEGWAVVGTRLGVAVTLLFLLTTGVRVGAALHPDGAVIALVLGIGLAVPSLLGVRRLARRMEERADARARSTAGGAALADALSKIHADARMPMVTGARRVHPDLYDRLVACGRDPGPRPSPPRRRAGTIVGLAVGGAMVLAFFAVERMTRIDLAEAPIAGASAARWRLRADPWDASAMLAWAWATRREEDLGLAEAQLAVASWMGLPGAERMELEAELLAARGDCAGARARFDEALAARARRAFEEPWAPLELGGWHLPPTLVLECGYGGAER